MVIAWYPVIAGVITAGIVYRIPGPRFGLASRIGGFQGRFSLKKLLQSVGIDSSLKIMNKGC
ncbi:MAG: hypothetical protein ABEI52_09980 [Halobacteriaceae archaeon]